MIADYEQDLLERAASWSGQQDCSELTAGVLREITAEHGIDFATALAYDRLRRSPQHGPFIEWMDQRPAVAARCQRAEGAPPDTLETCRHGSETLVAVVPGAFYREYPFTGADGGRVLDLARRSGYRAERVPLPSLGAFEENACILRDWLTKHAADDIVLVSLSKGGADVKMALAEPDAERIFEPVRAWINISGILDGTPLVDWVLARRLPSLFVRFLCWWHGQRFDVFRSLAHATGRVLGRPLKIPGHMRVVHLVGFPLKHHLSSRWARRAHRRLQDLGPSDGGGILLADVLRWPGLVYPVWGADHYMRAPGHDVVDLLRRLLVSFTPASVG